VHACARVWLQTDGAGEDGGRRDGEVEKAEGRRQTNHWRGVGKSVSGRRKDLVLPQCHHKSRFCMNELFYQVIAEGITS
jgi:hypothetical protein